MTRWIASWFYTETPSEGGAYAQVRGTPSSQDFLDIYRRCVAVHFASARRSNPDASLVLFTNVPWDREASEASRDVERLLSELDVEFIVQDYSYAPPPTWSPNWRNQFFVLDVLEQLSKISQGSDSVMLLDSDVVWMGQPRSELLWQLVESNGVATYTIDYPLSSRVNGMSRLDLQRVSSSITGASVPEIAYSGGEFVGLRHDVLQAVVKQCRVLWDGIQQLHNLDRSIVCEEAHLLSAAYAALGLPVGSANKFVKRIWTQPLKPRNTTPEDLQLALWHLPAEKKYGLQRLYQGLLSRGTAQFRAESQTDFLRRASITLGVPSNGIVKWCRDVSRAALSRLER